MSHMLNPAITWQMHLRKISRYNDALRTDGILQIIIWNRPMYLILDSLHFFDQKQVV